MIFQKTWQFVLARRKSQTLRLCYAGDYLGETAAGETAVFDTRGRSDRRYHRPRWIVGHTYAVQRERCHPAVGRFRITSLARLEDPTAVEPAGPVDLAFARREGFDSIEEYLRVWHELHKKNPVQPVWVIGFELIEPAQRGLTQPSKPTVG